MRRCKLLICTIVHKACIKDSAEEQIRIRVWNAQFMNGNGLTALLCLRCLPSPLTTPTSSCAPFWLQGPRDHGCRFCGWRHLCFHRCWDALWCTILITDRRNYILLASDPISENDYLRSLRCSSTK